jgi:hypothetical protein
MKGYLHRLAAQAIGPRGGVHPMVGFIYAGAAFGTLRTESEPIAAEEPTAPRRILVEREKSEALGQHSQVGRNLGAPRAARVAADERQNREPARSGAIFEPLVKRAEGAAVAFTPIHREVAETEPATSRTQFVPDKDQRSDAEPRYTPLLPRRAGSAFLAQPHRHETSLQVEKKGREAETVQIHIERIEVTAVTEAQRPPAARTRKSLDLEEYLKRRDGRVG